MNGKPEPGSRTAVLQAGALRDRGADDRAGLGRELRCRTCRPELRVDLKVIAIVREPGFVLWNRTSRCRRTTCRGVVVFLARAPGMSWHEPVEAFGAVS